MLKSRRLPKNLLNFFDYNRVNDDAMDDFFYQKEKIRHQQELPRYEPRYRDYVKNWGIQI